jgi:hypothetical protein
MADVAAAGTVWTVSPRQSLDFIERVLRRRLADEDSVTLAAGDERQDRQLRRLYQRLRSDPWLDVFLGVGEADGVHYLAVSPAALLGIGQSRGLAYRLTPTSAKLIRRRAVHGWWGSPKVR